jgi:hypothetical protein
MMMTMRKLFRLTPWSKVQFVMATGQDKFPFLWSTEVHCCVYRSPKLNPFLSQLNPVTALTALFFEINAAIVRLQVLTAASLKMTVCWHVDTCRRNCAVSDSGSRHLWNVSQFLPDYTAQHPRRQSSSYWVQTRPVQPLLLCRQLWSLYG